MKYLYVGLLILSLLLCACYFSTRILSERTEALLVPLEQAARAAQSGDHAAKDRYLSRAAKGRIPNIRNTHHPYFQWLTHKKHRRIPNIIPNITLT